MRPLSLLLPALLALSACDAPETRSAAIAGADPSAGRRTIAEIGCGVCHAIPGVPGARGTVGPPLAGFASRAYIAGVIPNEPGNLIKWVRDAPALAPETDMPALPLSEEQARDVASYLYSLR